MFCKRIRRGPSFSYSCPGPQIHTAMSKLRHKGGVKIHFSQLTHPSGGVCRLPQCLLLNPRSLTWQPSLLQKLTLTQKYTTANLSCATGAFGGKESQRITTFQARTRILVYKPLVLPTLLYGPHTAGILKPWSLSTKDGLRNIMRISWEDKRINTSVPKEANISSTTHHQL